MSKFIKIECLNGRVVYLNVANITAIEDDEDSPSFTIYTNGLDIAKSFLYFVVEGSASDFIRRLGIYDFLTIKALN